MESISTMLRSLFLFCTNSLSYRSEVDYVRACDDREVLTDDEFIKQYYANCNIPSDIPIRLRKLFGSNLGMTKVIPDDDFTHIMRDIDISNFIMDIEHEFDISIPEKDILGCDGSFQSLVLLIWKNS